MLFKDDGYRPEYYVFNKEALQRRRSEWAARDRLALERFKAVVGNRKMDAGSSSQQ